MIKIYGTEYSDVAAQPQEPSFDQAKKDETKEQIRLAVPKNSDKCMTSKELAEMLVQYYLSQGECWPQEKYMECILEIQDEYGLKQVEPVLDGGEIVEMGK